MNSENVQEKEYEASETSEARRIRLWKEAYTSIYDSAIAEEMLQAAFDDSKDKGVAAIDELNNLYKLIHQTIRIKLQPSPSDDENARLLKVSTWHKLFEAYTGIDPVENAEEQYTLDDWEEYYRGLNQSDVPFEEFESNDLMPVIPANEDKPNNALRNFKKTVGQIIERKNKTRQNIVMLQEAVGKVKRALPMHGGKYDPDRVPIKAGEEDIYLSEIISAKQINQTTGAIADVIPMNDADRLLHQVFYQDTKLVRASDSKIASTMGMRSKHKDNFQSFVLSKSGELYLFNSDEAEQRADGKWRLSTHGAVMDERPAEMAGIMTINSEGKIDYIEDHSGHYRPDQYDMWRGVKVLAEKGVLSDNCRVNVEGGKISAKEFMDMMAEPGPSGKPLHEELKQDRYIKHVRYAIKYQNANAAEALNEAGVNKDYRDSNGETGLHWVFAKIGENKKHVIARRKELGSKLGLASTQDEQDKITSEIKSLSVKSAKADIVLTKAVQDLLEAGYDPNAKDNAGKTPADYARMHGKMAGVAELEHAQAQIKEKTRIVANEKKEAVANEAIEDQSNVLINSPNSAPYLGRDSVPPKNGYVALMRKKFEKIEVSKSDIRAHAKPQALNKGQGKSF